MNDDAQSAEPKQKRPWCKPRVRLVEFAVTKGSILPGNSDIYYEGLPGPSGGGPNPDGYDPNIS